jgi:fibronectin type 3 domain-containing protein
MSTGRSLSYINWLFPPGSPLVEKMFEIEEYRQIYEGYFKEFITPSNKLFLYSDYEEKFNQLYQLYAPYLENDIDEGEAMINEESTGKYFYERTKSAIDELSLDEENYETRPTSLSTPTGVSATNAAHKDMITVEWDPVSFADYYKIYRSDSADGSYEQIGDTISSTNFHDQSVSTNATYYYKVKAFTHDGVESKFSSEVAGSTNDGSITVPSGVSATDGTYNHMITVSWNHVLNADYYRVYRSDSVDGTYVQTGDNLSVTRFDDKSAEVNATYYYRVKAFTAAGAETGFSTEDAGHTSETGLGPPEIIEGSALVRGTYANRSEAGTTTYTFKVDKTCKKSTRNASGGGSKTAGEWSYDDDGKALTIDTTASVGAAGIRMIEVWENAYTTYGGSVLNLLGFRKTNGDQDGILGKYEASANINVAFGVGANIFSVKITSIISINADGTWDLETTANTNGEIETTTATGSGYPNRLVEFNGSYYLSVFGIRYIKKVFPVTMSLNTWEHTDDLKNSVDLQLQTTEAPHLANMYYAIIPKLSSMLSQNPVSDHNRGLQ